MEYIHGPLPNVPLYVMFEDGSSSPVSIRKAVVRYQSPTGDFLKDSNKTVSPSSTVVVLRIPLKTNKISLASHVLAQKLTEKFEGVRPLRFPFIGRQTLWVGGVSSVCGNPCIESLATEMAINLWPNKRTRLRTYLASEWSYHCFCCF